MDSKRRLDDALDLAIGHQRPGVSLDQTMLADAVRGKLDPWESQLDRAKISLKYLGIVGRILLHFDDYAIGCSPPPRSLPGNRIGNENPG